MYETPDEIAWLQERINESHAALGPHAAVIIEPTKQLSAEQVVTLLQDTCHVALATVSADGRPFVAPVDAFFVHGRFHALTDGASVRARHLARRRDVSATWFDGDRAAVTVHGEAEVLRPGDPRYDEVDADAERVYGQRLAGFATDPMMVRIEPRRVITYAGNPAEFASGPAAR